MHQQDFIPIQSTQGAQATELSDTLDTVTRVLGQTMLVPGTKPLHQPIQGLFKILPDLGRVAEELTMLLQTAARSPDPAVSSGLPAALVSCLGSPALRGHLDLDAELLLRCACAQLGRATGLIAGHQASQEGLDLLLDSGMMLSRGKRVA